MKYVLFKMYQSPRSIRVIHYTCHHRQKCCVLAPNLIFYVKTTISCAVPITTFLTWTISPYSLADPRGGARDARPPLGSKFFHFHAVFGKNVKNNSNFGSWRPPLGKILDPPLILIGNKMKRPCYLIQSLLFMSIKFVELRSNTLPHQS